MNEQYKFAELQGHNELINEISGLEQKLQKALGKEINLIAYSKTSQQSGEFPDTTGCRAGIGD